MKNKKLNRLFAGGILSVAAAIFLSAAVPAFGAGDTQSGSSTVVSVSAESETPEETPADTPLPEQNTAVPQTAAAPSPSAAVSASPTAAPESPTETPAATAAPENPTETPAATETPAPTDPVQPMDFTPGWNLVNGKYYYYLDDGTMVRGQWFKDGNDWYYFNDDGTMKSAEWFRDGIDTYYLRDWGGMLHDQFYRYEGKLYYFRGWGGMMYNIKFQANGKWYKANADGTLVTGWSEENGKYYYYNEDGSLYTQEGWLNLGGTYYYISADGSRVQGQWLKDKNDWYYMNDDGTMKSAEWFQDGIDWYYLRDWGGRLHSGEFVVDGETYYFNADGVLTDKKELSQVIVIDPGHQGQGDSRKEPVGPGSSVMKARVTSGTTGCVSGLDEYELNLQVSLLLRTELESRGYTVYMTRETHDVNISNKERAEYASSVGGDILVRIHANGDDNSSVNGALCMAPSDSNAFVSALAPESQRLSQCIIDSYCQATGLRNRGVMITDDMSGINWSTMPVTIVEMGFMSNAGDDSKMADSDFQKKMVDGIADGIDQYFQ